MAFITDNVAGGNAGREVVIVIRPVEDPAKAKKELFTLAQTFHDNGDYDSAQALRNYGARVEELAQPVQQWESADGTDNDQG